MLVDKTEKPRSATSGVPEQGLDTKRTVQNKTKHTRPGKEKKGDDPALWAKVAPGARWKDCLTHGPVECPDLRLLAYRNGAVHIAAHCPECDCYLGNLKQVREEITDSATLMQRFIEYRRQAKAMGYKEGQAYYRFRHDFGREPDPAWLRGEKRGEA